MHHVQQMPFFSDAQLMLERKSVHAVSVDQSPWLIMSVLKSFGIAPTAPYRAGLRRPADARGGLWEWAAPKRTLLVSAG